MVTVQFAIYKNRGMSSLTNTVKGTGSHKMAANPNAVGADIVMFINPSPLRVQIDNIGTLARPINVKCNGQGDCHVRLELVHVASHQHSSQSPRMMTLRASQLKTPTGKKIPADVLRKGPQALQRFMEQHCRVADQRQPMTRAQFLAVQQRPMPTLA